jgi:hypothetical protein
VEKYTREAVIEMVVERIQKDVAGQYYSAIYELLSNVPSEDLLAYLPAGEHQIKNLNN